ncbi:MAG: EAL domain-containing protein [Pseudomonadota bacterium]
MSGDDASHLFFVLDGASGRVVDVAEDLARMLDQPLDALIGQRWDELLDVEQPDSLSSAASGADSTAGAGWVGAFRQGDRVTPPHAFRAALNADGDRLYISVTPLEAPERGTSVAEAPTPGSDPGGVASVATTPSSSAELSQQFFHMSEHLLGVLDADANIVLANPSFVKASILPADRITGTPVRSALQMQDAETLEQAVRRLSQSDGAEKMSVRVTRESGVHVLSVRLRSEPGASEVFLAAHDVTEEHRLNEQLVDRATRDQLTRLANREAFNAELERAVAEAEPLAMIMLDLDDFKRVNDSLGHSVGDELLAITGHRIVNVVRQSDLVARFGGDEFLILLRDIASPTDVERIAEKIRLALSLPCMIGGRKIHVTTSIGAAMGQGGSHDAERLFYEADAAAYEAKRLGRNRWILFDQQLDSALREQAAIEVELQHAISNNGIVPYVQGIHSVDGTLRGVEVLVRVRSVSGKMLSPGHFLDVARQLGLLTKLGEHVYDSALEQLAPWLAENPNCTVSLNADPREIVAPGFARILRRVIVKHRVEPRQIYLEVTETGILAAAGLGGKVIAELREMGIRIAIDDFGTGASSLGYLRDLMIDRIKIDRTFVTNLHLNPSNATITETVIRLGEALGINVVAEGVESQRELDHVASLGAPAIQGYFFHKPESISDFLAGHGDATLAKTG